MAEGGGGAIVEGRGGAVVGGTGGAVVVATAGDGAVCVDDGNAVVWAALALGVAFVGVDDPVELQAANPIDSPMAGMVSTQSRSRDIAVPLVP